jgi:hypothetical protein
LFIYKIDDFNSKAKYIGGMVMIYADRAKQKEYYAQWFQENKQEHNAKCRQNYYLKYKEKQEEWRLQVKYGITKEHYFKMLTEQEGKCKICGTSTGGNRFGKMAIDHCHKTGKVRGLLCIGCNNGLGCFKDDITRLKKAIDYLKAA